MAAFLHLQADVMTSVPAQWGGTAMSHAETDLVPDTEAYALGSGYVNERVAVALLTEAQVSNINVKVTIFDRDNGEALRFLVVFHVSQ